MYVYSLQTEWVILVIAFLSLFFSFLFSWVRIGGSGDDHKFSFLTSVVSTLECWRPTYH